MSLSDLERVSAALDFTDDSVHMGLLQLKSDTSVDK